MKTRTLFTFLLLVYCITGYSKSNNNFDASEGILDLSRIDLEKSDMIKLQGNVEFYWRALYEPSDFNDPDITSQAYYNKIPKSWSSYSLDSINKLPNHGYGTYRVIIKKKPNTERTIYGLKIYTIFSNYKLWVNGQLVSEVGTVSNEKDLSIPKFKFQDVPFILDPEEGPTDEIELVFQVSNYSHLRAGLQRNIFFSTYENLKDESRRMDILNLLIIGIIMVIGLNHINMFLFRRKDISNLYFGIVCIVMILRNVSTGDRLITYIIPNIDWELLFKFDNFSGFGTIPLFALFFYSLFKDDFPKFMRNIIIGVGVIITAIVFSTPANLYGKIRMVFELYILIFGLYVTFGVLLVAAIRKRPTAFFTFIGMFILYATAINDVLSSMSLVSTGYVAPYGLVVFMLIQSITITSKSALAISSNENLQSELMDEKENLEKNIQDRTQELQAQRDELLKHQEIEQQRSWVNSGLTQLNDVLSDNKNDFKVLSKKVLTAMVKYVKANVGVLYVINDEDEKDIYLELVADYGCSNDVKKNKSKIAPTTGMIGASYSENKMIRLDEVPENYIKINSGLGEARPASLLIMPLSVDDKVYGIIELGRFESFTKLEIEFIERIAVNIATNLNTVKMNEKNVHLIDQFQEQRLLMQEKEEEMRQNLEEMQAIKEQYDELREKEEKRKTEGDKKEDRTSKEEKPKKSTKPRRKKKE